MAFTPSIVSVLLGGNMNPRAPTPAPIAAAAPSVADLGAAIYPPKPTIEPAFKPAPMAILLNQGRTTPIAQSRPIDKAPQLNGGLV